MHVCFVCILNRLGRWAILPGQVFLGWADLDLITPNICQGQTGSPGKAHHQLDAGAHVPANCWQEMRDCACAFVCVFEQIQVQLLWFSPFCFRSGAASGKQAAWSLVTQHFVLISSWFSRLSNTAWCFCCLHSKWGNANLSKKLHLLSSFFCLIQDYIILFSSFTLSSSITKNNLIALSI